MKNCDLGPEKCCPRSQFFTIRTSQPANIIYMYLFQNCFPVWNFVPSAKIFYKKSFLSVEISFILLFLALCYLRCQVWHYCIIYKNVKKVIKLSCLVLSCLVLSCLVLSCLVLSCLVLSCLVLSKSNGLWGCVENHFVRAIEHIALSSHSRGWENSLNPARV